MLGVRDADFDARDIETVADAESAIKRDGKCAHGWTQKTKCLECGKVFESETEMAEERRWLINEYL